MKFKNTEIGKFRSLLERECDKIIKESGLRYTYEEHSFILQEKFKFDQDSYEKWGKKLINRKEVQSITYTPDFVIENDFIIEVKGYFTDVARLKWKMFKHHIKSNGLPYHVYMVYNKKQMSEVISMIKKKIEEQKDGKKANTRRVKSSRTTLSTKNKRENKSKKPRVSKKSR